MSPMIIGFAVTLVIVAVLTKVVGCGAGAKLCKYSNKDCVRIGAGMVSRGEVALIVAAKGNAIGLISADLMGPIVIVVVITTIISPILLKMTFSEKDHKDEGNDFVESDLMKQLEEYDEEMEKEQSRYVTIKDKK